VNPSSRRLLDWQPRTSNRFALSVAAPEFEVVFNTVVTGRTEVAQGEIKRLASGRQTGKPAGSASPPVAVEDGRLAGLFVGPIDNDCDHLAHRRRYARVGPTAGAQDRHHELKNPPTPDPVERRRDPAQVRPHSLP